MNLSLAGKNLVVIGGTSGLGLSAVSAFVEAEARVVVVSNDAQGIHKVGEEFRKQVIAMTGDATDPATADQAISTLRREWGDLHGLYHVAGGSGRRAGDGPLHEISDEGWSHTLKLNLDSVFYSNRAAVRAYVEQKSGGSVLNLGSVLGFSPSPFFFGTHAYATAKAAIIGMTRASASYYSAHSIRFNVLAPGLVRTPMSARAQEDEGIMAFTETKQPLDGGRIGEPQDLDAAAVYFMSDESRFVTGQVLSIDGGWGVSEGQVGGNPE